MRGRPQHSDATTAVGESPETPGKLTREDVAKIEIGHTDVPRWLSVVLTVGFMLVILAVPVSQAFRGDQALAIVRHAVHVDTAWKTKEGGLYSKLFAANAEALKQITEYEDALEDESWMTQTLLGPVTSFKVRCFGAGNEEAYIGESTAEGQWLFYRPDIDHVTGPGFLEEDRLALRAAAGNEYTDPPQPDPRKAILQFRDQLAERGIELVVMPTPVKPTAAPGKFTERYANFPGALVNSSCNAFLADLQAAGVNVFDPTGLLRDAESYLRTDTHWTPEAMQRIASALTERLGPVAGSRNATSLDAELEEVTNLGDIAVMLELPDNQTVFDEQTVTVRRITHPPEGDAAVLLLGDSFTNIYSMADLGWGTNAGLGQQLAYELGQPVEVIAINAGGSHAARRALVGELARGNDRLAGKKVVIWQFAMRELSSGDWKLMNLPRPTRTDDSQTTSEQAVNVSATITAKTEAPRPGSVPYRDAVISVILDQVEGGNITGPILVYTWGLRDNKLVDQPWRVGQTVKVKLTPWAEVEKQYGSYNRFELDDPDALFLDAYWGEVIE